MLFRSTIVLVCFPVTIKEVRKSINRLIEKSRLKEKQEYCERYEYNCGWGYMFGTIDGELSYVEVYGEEYLDCRQVKFTVDLEHG